MVRSPASNKKAAGNAAIEGEECVESAGLASSSTISKQDGVSIGVALQQFPPIREAGPLVGIN